MEWLRGDNECSWSYYQPEKLRVQIASAALFQKGADLCLGRVLARSGNMTETQPLMKTHRQLVDTKGRIKSLERQAVHEPHNIEVRRSLAKVYEEIGLKEQATFRQSAACAAEQSQL